MRYRGSCLHRKDVAGEAVPSDDVSEEALVQVVYGSQASHALHQQGRHISPLDNCKLQPGLDPRTVHGHDHIAGLKLIAPGINNPFFWQTLRAVPPQSALGDVVSSKEADGGFVG